MTTDEIIEEAVKRLVAAAHPERIILFGSQARGEAREDSDIDLLVILEDTESRRAEMVRLGDALRGLPVPIDVLVFTLDDVKQWGSVRGTVLYPALQEGVVLYDAA
jgi:predicted nucleotidyltransferase